MLPDLKGLHDIRRLMEQAGEEIHCLDLDERIVENRGDDVLDEKARNALKARIRDLQEDLAEAEDMNDTGRSEGLREEMDFHLETLSAALGLGGRRRRLGDSAEKARTAGHVADPPRGAEGENGEPRGRTLPGRPDRDRHLLQVRTD